MIVIQTGTANTASVVAAFRRLGADPVLSTDPADVGAAEHVVLPGVGAFGAGMDAVRGPLGDAVVARIAADRPTLCICLGLQLLARSSEESAGIAGLGVLDVEVGRFPAGVVVPQLGWNTVTAEAGCRFLTTGAAYYANSYRLPSAPDGWLAGRSEHGGSFIGALERGNVLACQFHPELSGSWGAGVLERWLTGAAATSSVERAPGLKRRIVPCLDVRDGRVVKGVKFQGLRDAGDPATQAGAYAASGADELVVLDVSATPEGRSTALKTVEAVRAVIDVPLTVGGGVRKVEHAAALLAAGADKVGINTAAVRDPSILDALAERFGSQCVVLALDAAATDDGWEVVVRSGTERTGLDAVEWAREAVRRGAGEILLTSWDRDGTRSGYDTALVAAISSAVSVPVVASGGADTADHLAEALDAGADAVLAASIFHDGDTTPDRLKQTLAARGLPVRI